MKGVLTFLCCCYLIPIVLSAYPLHFVRQLPGQPLVSFKQYAGQVIVNETSQKALFYWFVEADHPNATSLPIVLWLSGGPGCSSVGAGSLSELGPFRTNTAATGLTRNPHAWNKAANMIFLESPYGVGFSYSNTSSDYNSFGDHQTAADAVLFLLKWFSMFPSYKNNDFYLTGESYAGHYVPMLALHIIDYNKETKNSRSRLKLKGFAIGNPWTAEIYDNLGNLEFLFSHSVISEEVYENLKKFCYPEIVDDVKCGMYIAKAGEMSEFINSYNIYSPSCNPIVSRRFKLLKERDSNYAEMLAAAYADPCLDSVTPYMNLPKVQASLNIKKWPVEWNMCSPKVNKAYSQKDVSESMLPVYKKLLKSGIRIWIYSGDLDGVVSSLATRSWIKKLDLNITIPWYAWHYKNQVGGWSQVYKGLTFTTVRGSGHMAPLDKPSQSLVIFNHFLRGKSLSPF